MDAKTIFERFEKLGNPKALEGMRHFGIKVEKAYGVRVPNMRQIAKEIKKDHPLALELWKYDIHEAKILATMIADPKQLTSELMEDWVKDFYSWDVCDQCIMNFFEKHELAWQKAIEWIDREEEYVKRAGYVLMARLAVSDKKASDDKFTPFFELIKKGATDERNFVKKAVNWAIRQIGKRNLLLNKKMITLSQELKQMNSKSAKWIAGDAIRELDGEAVQQRLKAQALKK